MPMKWLTSLVLLMAAPAAAQGGDPCLAKEQAIQARLAASHAAPSDAEATWLARRLIAASRGNRHCDVAALPPVGAPARFPRRAEPVRTPALQQLAAAYDRALAANDDREGYRLAMLMAEAGDIWAIETVAIDHLGGYGVPVDPAEGLRWHERAYAKGSPFSATVLGLHYIEGDNVAKNPARGVDYLMVAAERAHSGGFYNLGVAFETGAGGLKVNEPLAAALIVRGAERGNERARRTAAEMFFNGRMVPRDPAKALALTRALADEGDAAAQNQLGICFAGHCPGTAKDVRQAEAWYLKAAAQKHAKAMFNLGLLYQADDALFDLQKSLGWYRAAQAAGVGEARAEIAHITAFLDRPQAPTVSMDQQTVNRAWSGYGQQQGRQQVCTNDYSGGRYQRICRDARPGEVTVPSYW